MRTICVTLNDEKYTSMGGLYGTHEGGKPSRLARARQHFAERGVNAQFFFGIHATQLAIENTLTYEVDNPGTNFRIGPKPTGCWLSHRAVWAACLLLSEDPNELFFILEDDAKFPEDWKERVEAAVRDARDFDMLYIGSCCTEGRPTKHIAGNVYEVQWPLCNHGYIVRRSALMTMIETQDAARLYAPIDISLVFHTMEQLKVGTVKPRILDQFDTEIPP